MSAVAEAILTHDSEGASEEGRFRELDVQAQPAKGPLKENWRLVKKDRKSFFPTTRLIPVSLAYQHSQPSYSGGFVQIGGMGHWLI